MGKFSGRTAGEANNTSLDVNTSLGGGFKGSASALGPPTKLINLLDTLFSYDTWIPFLTAGV
jgi:hypothetical protein